MRKLFLFITLLFSATGAFTSQAQAHYKPHVWIGARAGADMSRLSFSPAVNQRWLPGSEGFVSFRYAEQKIFGLIIELGWQQRGWSENFGDDNPLRYKRNLTYLSLPVMSHLYFGSRRFQGFINLGPEVSMLISQSTWANFDYTNPTSSPDWPTRNRQTEQLTAPIKNKFDYGIAAGAGMEFRLTPRHSITLECRFYYGLGNIFPASKADTFGASRSMTLGFSAGYWFRLK